MGSISEKYGYRNGCASLSALWQSDYVLASRARKERNGIQRLVLRILMFLPVRSTLPEDLSKITFFAGDVQKSSGESSLWGPIGPEVGPRGVYHWLRACRESQSCSGSSEVYFSRLGLD